MSTGPVGKRRLAAGVIDAGVASSATFAAGLAGVNLLGDANRGIYGIFFTAFFLGSVVISELILVPAQVVAVGKPREERLGLTRRSLYLGIGPGLVAMLVAPVAATFIQDLTSPSVITALATTTAVTIVVSPMQDHIRQLLHIAKKSWHAVAVSTVQLFGVVSTIGAMLLLDVQRAWIPFGSLAAANVLSLSVAFLLAGGHRSSAQDGSSLTFRSLAASGKWLVIRAATPAAFAFLSANILTRLAGPEAYGYAEAARQVAQPITVLSVGLMAVLGPRAVRAGAELDARAARSNRMTYMTLMVLGGGLYIAIAGFSWDLNPMTYLVPSAYVVGGLVAATVAANLLIALFLILGRELLGGGRARMLAIISILAAPALPLAAATAAATEAFARPLGYILQGVIRVSAGDFWLRRHYAGSTRAQTGSRSTVSESGLAMKSRAQDLP